MELHQIGPNSIEHLKRQKKIYFWAFFILLVILFSFFYVHWISDSKKVVKKEDVVAIKPVKENVVIEIKEPKEKFVPHNFTMEMLKTKGCVADGFLSEYGDNTKEMIELINRSECQYFHRALETWLSSPDFNRAQEIMVQIKKPNIVFGMFIAEAINRRIRYYNPKTNENFDFSDMCRPDTENVWGEGTCKPSLEKSAYRKYLKFITEQAMDAGVQSFLFGQIYFQEEGPTEKSRLPEIIQAMRDYAKNKNLQIVIGAQTGAITDADYLKNFDYIEGGVGMNNQGAVESGSCLSWRGGCWALLWHQKYRKLARNVFLHLDWSGIESDDMSRFARMDAQTRKNTLYNLYQKFTLQKMGFLMPMLAPLYKENGGCYGPKKRFYSSGNEYSCKDEDTINAILKGKYKP